MSRLQMKMSATDYMVALSDGNPGALSVLVQLIQKNALIDPDDWAGELGAMIQLDNLGIYGSSIWVLFKDVCKQEIVHVIMLLRAVQLGLMKKDTLLQTIRLGGGDIELDKILALVQAELPRFASYYSEKQRLRKTYAGCNIRPDIHPPYWEEGQ